MIPILILAAGQSTRMRGTDKLAEDVAGSPLLRLQAMRAAATGNPVFVALPGPDHPRMGLLQDLDIKLFFVPDAAAGMGVTLRESVARLPECAAFLVVLADLVDLDTSDLKTVIAAREAKPDADAWRGETVTGQPGHPILFAAHLRPRFADIGADRGAASLLAAPDIRVCRVPLPGTRALLDLDTPEDWAAWRATQTKR